jgi:phosphatidylserine decarboxylase
MLRFVVYNRRGAMGRQTLNWEKLQVVPQYLLPQVALTQWLGRLADRELGPFGRKVVRWFIDKYGVNMEEALEPNPEAYATFNDFFTRAIDLRRRPLCKKHELASPADGIISQLGTIEQGALFQAKGHHFRTVDLLGGYENLANTFADGEYATIYLSPRDYHRVHMPIEGQLRETWYVPGRLFSVNPLTARQVPELFARNERLVCIFDTAIGKMAMVLVGATIVGSIETVWDGVVTPPRRSEVHRQIFDDGPVIGKGKEMGRFRLGSTVILLFQKRCVKWRDHLGHGEEVRVRQAIGDITEMTDALS